MSAPTPTGEASTSAAPPVPVSQPQTAPTPAAPQSASTQPTAAPQQPGVSESNLTQTQHTVPVAQGQAQGLQGQQGQPAPTGVAGGPSASVPRAPAAITRDTYAVRSLGPAVNSLVKKVCETPPPSWLQRFADPRSHFPSIPSLKRSSEVSCHCRFLEQPRMLWTRMCPSATSTSQSTQRSMMCPLHFLLRLTRTA